MAVVKADAYGHGAVEVCRRLSDAGATHFAVACMEEAALLRRSGIRGELLVLGITPQELYPAIAEYDVVQTVSSLAYASQLADCGPVRVHIKIDTGMSAPWSYCHTLEDVARTAEDVARIAALPGLKVEGIFTHFAESDAPQSDFTRRQFAVFSALLAELERRGVDCGLRHCCNSAGNPEVPRNASGYGPRGHRALRLRPVAREPRRRPASRHVAAQPRSLASPASARAIPSATGAATPPTGRWTRR